jgi:hypothetical protein
LRVHRSALRWLDWTRYSTRQDTLMQMGGLVGDLHLSGLGLPALWPLFGLGAWVQLGKGTSLGLGRYELATPASLPVTPSSLEERIITGVGSMG